MQSQTRRSGVVQYTQPHALLAGGAAALDSLVPGFLSELRARGGLTYDGGVGLKVYDLGGQFCEAPTRTVMCGCSRRLLNEVLQDKVTELGGARFELRDKTKVAGLLWDANSSRGRTTAVRGVLLSSGEEVSADLVIVCDGRSSRLPNWLTEGGVTLPPKKKVDGKVSYANCWLKAPEGFDPEKEFYGFICGGRPHSLHIGMVFAVENGAIQALMAGLNGESAPLDYQGWVKYAKSLPDPTIYDLISRCEPLTPITRMTSLPNTLPQYHAAKGLPHGLVITGDAFMQLNPLRGQGMSVAALEAAAVDAFLTQKLSKKSTKAARIDALRALSPRALHRAIKKVSGPAWDAAILEDARWPGTQFEGVDRPPKMLLRFTDGIIHGCQKDGRVWIRVNRVGQFVDPPSSLFGSWSVLRRGLKNMFFPKKQWYQAAARAPEHGLEGKCDDVSLEMK